MKRAETRNMCFFLLGLTCSRFSVSLTPNCYSYFVCLVTYHSRSCPCWYSNSQRTSILSTTKNCAQGYSCKELCVSRARDKSQLRSVYPVSSWFLLAQFLYGFLPGLRGQLISVTYLGRTTRSNTFRPGPRDPKRMTEA